MELDVGEKIPEDIKQFDGMFCMGGPMDTWMTEKYSWIVEEKNKIKEYVIDLEKPFLGFCLGCQFLGEVVGGKVVKSSPPEILTSVSPFPPMKFSKAIANELDVFEIIFCFAIS